MKVLTSYNHEVLKCWQKLIFGLGFKNNGQVLSHLLITFIFFNYWAYSEIYIWKGQTRAIWKFEDVLIIIIF